MSSTPHPDHSKPETHLALDALLRATDHLQQGWALIEEARAVIPPQSVLGNTLTLFSDAFGVLTPTLVDLLKGDYGRIMGEDALQAEEQPLDLGPDIISRGSILPESRP